MKIKKSLSVFLVLAMSAAFIPNTFAEAEDIIINQFAIEDVDSYGNDISATNTWKDGILSKFDGIAGNNTEFVKSAVLYQAKSSTGGPMAVGTTIKTYSYPSNWHETSFSEEFGAVAVTDGMLINESKTENPINGSYYSVDITEYYKGNCFDDFSVYVNMRSWCGTKETWNKYSLQTKLEVTYNTQDLLDAVNAADKEQMTDLLLSYGKALGVNNYVHISDTTRNFVNESLVGKNFTSASQLAETANNIIDENIIKVEYRDLTDEMTDFACLSASDLLVSIPFKINVPNNGYNLKNVASVDLQLYITNIYNIENGILYATNLDRYVGSGTYDGGKKKYYSINITDYAKSTGEDFILAPTSDTFITCDTSANENKEYLTVSYDKNGLLEELNDTKTAEELQTYFEGYGYALGFDKEYIAQYAQIVAQGLYNNTYESLDEFKTDASDAAALAASAVISELNAASSISEYRTILEEKYEMLGLDLKIYQQLSDSDKNKYLSQIKKNYATADEFKTAFNTMFSTALVLNTSVSNIDEMKNFIEANAEEIGLDLTHYNRITYKENFLTKLVDAIPYSDIEAFADNYNTVLENRIKAVKTIYTKEALGWYSTENENGETVYYTQASTAPARYSDKLFKFDAGILKAYAQSDNITKIAVTMQLSSGASFNGKEARLYEKSNDWSEASTYEELQNIGIFENSVDTLAGSEVVTVPANGTFDIDVTEYVKNAIANNTLGDYISFKTDNIASYYILRDNPNTARIVIYADVDSAVEEIDNASSADITEALISNAKLIDTELYGYKNLANKTDINNELLSRDFNTADEIATVVKELLTKQTSKKQINIVEEAGSDNINGFGAFLQPYTNLSDTYRAKFDLSGINMEYVSEITVSARRMNNNDPDDFKLNSNVYDYNSGKMINDFKILATSKGYNECDITDFAKTQSGEIWLAFNADTFTYTGNIQKNKAPYITVYYDIMHIVNDVVNAPSKDDAEFIIMDNREQLGVTSVEEITKLASLLWGSSVSTFAEYTELRNAMQTGGIICTTITGQKNGADVTGIVKVTNLTSMEAPLTVVVAAFTESNEMVAATVATSAGNVIQDSETSEITYTLKDTAFTPKTLEDAYEVRAIIYNSLSDLLPYSMQKSAVINR
ncbi:MAG: hypothetical protein SOZ34_08680 [Clostridia bacterium]|nr:hypothetical protein [Clostridia bacterium]